MIARLIDAIQTVAITMTAGFLMGLVSMFSHWWRGEEF